MKILVPIDFSSMSLNALKVAQNIANTSSSSVDLFHSFENGELEKVLKNNSELMKGYVNILVNEIEDKLEKLKQANHELEIESDVIIRRGNFIENIKSIERLEDYDLIVMGSHGASGFREWTMGSNAQKVVRNVEHNVLVVKNENEFNVSNVLYVSSLNKSDVPAFKNFLEFLSHFKVNMLHIMAVDTAFYFTQPRFIMQEALKDFKALADDFNVQTHFYADYSVEAGVRHFVHEKNVSLVGIANHQKGNIRRIFTGSNVESIVNHSEVPVLSINLK